MKKRTLVVGIGGGGCKIVSKIKDKEINRLMLDNCYCDGCEIDSDIINLFYLSPLEIKYIILEKIKDFGEIIIVNPADGLLTSSITISLIDLAKEYNKMVKLITSLPFGFEGKARKERALEMISDAEKLCEVVKVGITIDRPMSIKDAFSLFDEVFLNKIDKRFR